MKYYLASGLMNREKAAEAIAALNEKGLECVFDWTKAGDGPEEIRAMVDAVKLADVFILMPPYKRGAATELGVALGTGIPVLLCGGLEGDYHDFPKAMYRYWSSGLEGVMYWCERAIEDNR